jgi:CheY-like chemotaxis protein
MDGSELVRSIRADERLAHLKVCSVAADVETRAVYREQGFDALLLKPMTVDSLKGLFAGEV